MKNLVLILVLLAGAATVRADWGNLHQGIDRKAVLECVGRPLIANHSRAYRQETWTYDNGAYVQFELGRVTFFQSPRVKPGAPKLELGPVENLPLVNPELVEAAKPQVRRALVRTN